MNTYLSMGFNIDVHTNQLLDEERRYYIWLVRHELTEDQKKELVAEYEARIAQ